MSLALTSVVGINPKVVIELHKSNLTTNYYKRFTSIGYCPILIFSLCIVVCFTGRGVYD